MLEHTPSLGSLTWTLRTGLLIHRSVQRDFIECWFHAWSWGDRGEERVVSTLCSVQAGRLPALRAWTSPLHIALGLPLRVGPQCCQIQSLPAPVALFVKQTRGLTDLLDFVVQALHSCQQGALQASLPS